MKDLTPLTPSPPGEGEQNPKTNLECHSVFTPPLPGERGPGGEVGRLSIFIFLAILMLLAAITLTQSTLTRHKSTFARTENLSFLPQGSRLAPYLCGFQTTFASYLWIKTTLYFGSEYMGEKKYAWLIHMIDAVTRLNPQFFPAYEFAGVMIPEVCHNPDVARIFLERGISHVVDKQKNSRLLFLAGWISFNYYNDHIRAAEYMERSAKIGNRRSFVTGFAATLYAKGGRKDMAIAYLASMLKDTEEPAARNMIISKLEGFGVKVE